MKKIFALGLCALLISSCFPGCSKDSDSSGNSYIRGKIDGVAFECTSGITANTPEPVLGPADPTIRVTGSWADNSIRLMIINESSSIASGTYTFDVTKQRSGTIYIGPNGYYAGQTGGGLSGGAFGLAGSGSITITKVTNNYVSGSFQFTSAPFAGVIKTVTDGEFSVKRQ